VNLTVYDPRRREPDFADLCDELADIVDQRHNQPWRRRAACRGVDPDIFFPPRGDHNGANRALAICARCPVRADCEAANLHQRSGVWGGTVERQRRKLRRGVA